MGVFLMIIAAIVAMSAMGTLGFVGGMFGTTGGIPVIVMIVAIVVFGGILRELAKNRKDLKGATQKELVEIKEHIARIEADIGDIKEQIADFIIKQI